MMDAVGMDVAVLSCGWGFDQPDLATCRLINDAIHQASLDHPGRIVGLAHVPALDHAAARAELRRCAVDLGFPGAAIGSEIQGLALDDEALRPYWRAADELGLYVFVHPFPGLIAWNRMDADDLGRMLGWEFSLSVAAVRMINSGLLDELPNLRVQFAHFAGAIGRFLPRIRGIMDRVATGTDKVPRHNRTPAKPFDHYIDERLFFDCAGWTGRGMAALSGAEWVRHGFAELPSSQIVFATDYPQAVRDQEQVGAYISALQSLGADCRAMLKGANAEKLIPDLRQRMSKRVTADGKPFYASAAA
jgi:aminocarboxymuconate-semialdehyde decarboxylase